MSEQEQRVMMVMPDTRVFKNFVEYGNVINPSNQALSLSAGTPQFDHAEYPEEGGMFRFYKDFKYPEKCFAFPQAIYACNFSKREIVIWLRILSKHPIISLLFLRKRALKDILDGYVNVSNLMLSQFFYKDRFYCDFSKQIRAFMNGFLASFGVPNDMIALIFATILEHDNAYRYRIQDLALETSKDRLLNDFPAEMERLYEIYSKREGDSAAMRDKLASIVKIVKLGWYIPKFRKALRSGLMAMDWQKFLPDEADKYFMLIRKDYKCFGRTIEDRWNEWLGIHENEPPKLIYIFAREEIKKT